MLNNRQPRSRRLPDLFMGVRIEAPMRPSFFLLFLPLIASAASTYSAVKTNDHGVEIVRLVDPSHDVEVSIAPSVGNRAYQLMVHGKNLLYFPLPDVAGLANGKPPAFDAIPFLAPWAN